MGRPRKINVIRDKSGRSRGEREEIAPEVLAVRIRLMGADGVKPEHAKDALAGFTLGRLLLRWRCDKQDPGGISQEQYDAGNNWAGIVHRHASIMGYRLHIRSPSFLMVASGFGSAPDPDQEIIYRVRRQWSDYYNELMDCCRIYGIRVRDVTYGVCVENWSVATLLPSDFGLLRYGLNSLARVRQ